MRFDLSRRHLLPLTAALTLLAPGAQADSGRLLPRDMPAAYRQECASCHTAYPPGMLPAASWQRSIRTASRAGMPIFRVSA